MASSVLAKGRLTFPCWNEKIKGETEEEGGRSPKGEKKEKRGIAG